VKLKGKMIDRNFITQNELTAGGKLIFIMGSTPKKSRGIDNSAFPYSMSTSK
jgi:putative alpha-1,2-mannosidase